MQQPKPKEFITFKLDESIAEQEATLQRLNDIPGVKFAFMLSQNVPRWKNKGYLVLEDNASTNDILTALSPLVEEKFSHVITGYLGIEFQIKDDISNRQELLDHIRSLTGVIQLAFAECPIVGMDFGFALCEDTSLLDIVDKLRNLEQIDLAEPRVSQPLGPRS